MAVYQFSALSDGQAISFDPATDLLRFDQAAIAAADLRVSIEGAHARVAVVTGTHAGKDVLLQNVSPLQLATSNVTFADGSRLLFGDNSVTQNDNASNALSGTSGRDLLDGFGGADTLTGSAGNDVILGGAGNDTILMSAGGAASYGHDVIDGGAGTDKVDFGAAVASDVVINLAEGTISGGGQGGAGSATVTGVERVIAGAFNDLVIGDSVANHIDGRRGNDTMSGRAGNDTLLGRDGNDRLEGGTGNDTLTGGAGQDSFVFGDAPTSGTDDRITDFVTGSDQLVLVNTAFSAVGAAGDFSPGDARFWAAAGATSGHDATDRMVYNTSTGSLYYDPDGSGSGAAQLIATLAGAPAVAATDIAVIGEAGPAPIVGTEGSDTLAGTDGNDSIEGRGGDDSLLGLGGNDALDGGDGSDTLHGGEGFDLLEGGGGSDRLIDPGGFDPGTDTLNGGLGDDTYVLGDPLTAHNYSVLLSDPGGVDTVIANINFTLPDGFENLTMGLGVSGTGNELNNLIVTTSNEPRQYFVDGGDGNDTLLGGSSFDTFLFAAGSGDYGNDSVDGGHGYDAISFAGARSAVVIDMRAGEVSGGGAAGSGSVVFTRIEEIGGSAFDDRLIAHDGVTWIDEGDEFFSGGTLVGGNGNDTLIGGAATDILFGDGFPNGGVGDDELRGGAGNDQLSGGAGRDRFVFADQPGPANADSVRDFASGEDMLVLDSQAYANLGASGRFVAGDPRYFAGAGATSGQDADDRVIYNTSTGGLWYDADGSGAGASQLITVLERAPTLIPTLMASDITVIGGGGPTPIQGTAGNDSLTGTAGDDVLEGLGGNDTLSGLAGADTLQGGTGNDTFALGASYGNDVIDGGAGTDKVDFGADVASDLVINLADGTISGGGQGGTGSATLTGVERAIAGAFNDLVIGDSVANYIDGRRGNDTVSGRAGNDTLLGRDGNDRLEGGSGNDTLTGGAGQDSFVFGDAPNAGTVDRITDFVSGADELVLVEAAFASIGNEGDFNAGDARFWAAAGATSGHDATDRIVYNTSTGNLYYDADGSGSGAAQLLATFEGNPAIAASDLTVI